MIPILNFSWQDFQRVDIPNPNVSELLQTTQSHEPELYLLHDPTRHFSTLIIPEIVTDFLSEFSIPGDLPAALSGIYQIMNQNQMTVSEGTPANLAVGMAIKHEMDVVIALNQNFEPTGIFFPQWVINRLPRASMLSLNLQQNVEDFTKQNRLLDAILYIENELTDFHSEGLNFLRPTLFICEFNGKKHFTPSCPCSEHPSATCRPRNISSRH